MFQHNEGIKKLPIHDNGIGKQGGIAFDYEIVKEILGIKKMVA